MAYFDDVIKALGTEHVDDLVAARARIVELERQLSTAQNHVKVVQADYWHWQSRNGTSFTMGEELVIALNLQHVPPSEAVTRALAVIARLKEQGDIAGANSTDTSPVKPPDYWFVLETEGTVNDLADLVEDGEDGEIVQLSPVWHGRSRWAVIEPYLDEDGEQISSVVVLCNTEDEARVRRDAIEARQAKSPEVAG